MRKQTFKTENIIKKSEFLTSFVPPISLILVVLGSIITGLATPVAAALGVLGALIITTIQKNKLQNH